jgi:ribosomal protein L37AE/L43A
MNPETIIVLFTVFCIGLFLYAATKVPQCPKCLRRSVERRNEQFGDGSYICHCHSCGHIFSHKEEQ